MQYDGPEHHTGMLTHVALQKAGGGRGLEVASEQSPEGPTQAASMGLYWAERWHVGQRDRGQEWQSRKVGG